MMFGESAGFRSILPPAQVPGGVVAFRLEPAQSMTPEVQRLASERLADAVDRLDQLDRLQGATPAEIEEAVHEVRKRCKEVRGLARLVRPTLGPEFGRGNRLVRDAANELSSIRDAHALLSTFDDLRAVTGHEDDRRLNRIRDRQARSARRATDAIRAGDERIQRARQLLDQAGKEIRRWELPDGFTPLGAGLHLTYRRGRRGLRSVRREPTDDRVHDWRKAVKNLWYQVRLLERAAPSVLGPLAGSLDQLAESLGDDHDLAVLISRLESDPKEYGGGKAVRRAVRLARAQQDDLRRRAFRLGATIYAERPTVFVERVEAYWNTTIRLGTEVPTGGLVELLGNRDSAEPGKAESVVERERSFKVSCPPDLTGQGVELRQGYLAIDGTVSVRVRDAGPSGCTMTVKGGKGAVRTELEWPISRRQFEAAWAVTGDRRVDKTRYRLPHDGEVVELDVFHGELDGLVLAEVEFDSDGALASFEPPAWFGEEVTDDDRFTNASLAVNGLPTDSRS